MRRFNWTGLVLLLVLSLPAAAFDTVDEQIDHYLGVLSDSQLAARVSMLKWLKFTAITDPRLYDEIEKAPLLEYQNKKLDKVTLSDVAHKIRALGYSGNPKYRDTLITIQNDAPNKRIRGYATKALSDLGKYTHWNKLIADSDPGVEGKSAELTTYFKMLNTDDPFVQHLGARAIFEERHRDSDALELIAGKLQALYAVPGLDGQRLDTAAWFIKVLGQSGDYRDLLTTVNQNTPHKKLKKHSIKYIK